MGLLSFLKRVLRITFFTGIFVGAILFAPNLPPRNVQFTSFDLPPTKKLEGPLALNTKLNNAEKLFENLLKGPESLVHHHGVLYTGVYGGHVLKITENSMVPFVKFGKPCSGQHEEHICGRPLGLRLDAKNDLYVADAYYGIFKVNITTGEVAQLVDSETIIEGRKPKFFNSVALAQDGKIYWTDSDSNFGLNNILLAFLSEGTGRLIQYDPILKTNTVLISKLACANGVALSSDESQILVSEAFNFRMLRYYLKGSKKGQYEVAIDGLPGAPDNIKVDERGNMYVSLALARDDNHSFDVFHNVGTYPLLRKFIVRLMVLAQTGLAIIDNYFPHPVLKRIVYAIGNLETAYLFASSPQRVSVIKLNQDGRIIDSLHATDGLISSISEIEFANDYIYLGSPLNNYLARVKYSDPEPQQFLPNS